MVRKKPPIKPKLPRAAARTAPRAAPQPTFRSGAVARLARMPVSTLRIWEQRYQAIQPSTAASGHRLYSAADVQRVQLLRQLTEQGHAIGEMARLTAAQLQQVANTLATKAAGPRAQQTPPARTTRTTRKQAPLRVAVVGQALAQRLQRPAVAQRLACPWQVTAVFDSLAEAAHAAANTATNAAIDLLFWQAPGLQSSALPALKAAQRACRAKRVAVVYRYAGAGARQAFAGTGASVLRDPDDDAAMGDWLAALQGPSTAMAHAPHNAPHNALHQALTAGDVAPRRFDDAALTAFAGLPSAVACECPRHVAELLMQLSDFESYSADCASRSPADAELHAYLQRVAGLSRNLFEVALERVARQEGLMLS